MASQFTAARGIFLQEAKPARDDGTNAPPGAELNIAPTVLLAVAEISPQQSLSDYVFISDVSAQHTKAS